MVAFLANQAELAAAGRICKSDPPPTPASGRGFGRRKRLQRLQDTSYLKIPYYSLYFSDSSGRMRATIAEGNTITATVTISVATFNTTHHIGLKLMGNTESI